MLLKDISVAEPKCYVSEVRGSKADPRSAYRVMARQRCAQNTRGGVYVSETKGLSVRE